MYDNHWLKALIVVIGLLDLSLVCVADEIMELMKRTTRSGSVVSEYDLVGRAFAASPNSPFGGV